MVFVLFVLFFLSSFNSMSMIMVLILFTLFYSMKMYEVMGSFWFSFIVLMVVLSGILVLFTYMVSLSSNEKFEFNVFSLVMFVLLMLMSELFVWGGESELSSVMIWNQMMVVMNMMILIFLFITMFMVIKVSNLTAGALRI